MKKSSLFTLLISCLHIPIAFSASFNCSKAHSKIEKMICTDAELSAMDSELLPIYQQARKATNNSKAFRDNGRAALRWRTESCKDKACLVRWYNNRKAELLKIAQSNIVNTNTHGCVTDNKEITLTGRLKEGTYVGPPNFESIENGDKLMSYYYLETDKSMCAFTNQSFDGISLEKIKPQRYFHLVIMDKYPNLVKQLNKKITVTAVPYTRHTAYHQTPLLLTVKKLAPTK